MTFPRERLADVLRWLPLIEDNEEEEDNVCITIEWYAHVRYEGLWLMLSVSEIQGSGNVFVLVAEGIEPVTKKEYAALKSYVGRNGIQHLGVRAEEDPGDIFPAYIRGYEANCRGLHHYTWEEPRAISNLWCKYDVSEVRTLVNPAYSFLDYEHDIRLRCHVRSALATFEVLARLALMGRPKRLTVNMLCEQNYHFGNGCWVKRMLQNMFPMATFRIDYVGGERFRPSVFVPLERHTQGWWLKVATALLSGRAKGPVALLPEDLIRRAMCSFLQ
jgi:hypothetical protein